MMELANIFSLAEESAQGVFSTLSAYLTELELGAGELSAVGVAILLVVVWYFVRLIRAVVSILFTLCIMVLVLQLTGVLDFSELWAAIQNWLNAQQGAVPAAAPASTPAA